MDQIRENSDQDQLTWQREKLKELRSKGLTEREISSIMKRSKTTIHRLLTNLRQQAKTNISKYIDDQLPEEYENCLIGITAIMKESWTTAAKADSEGDRRDKLQALSLAKECYAMKIDLLSNATVVDRAVKFVQNYKTKNNRIEPLGNITKNGKVLKDSKGKGNNNTNDTTESVQNS